MIPTTKVANADVEINSGPMSIFQLYHSGTGLAREASASAQTLRQNAGGRRLQRFNFPPLETGKVRAGHAVTLKE